MSNLERFSGFADLYDSVRPAPPPALGPLLCGYAGRSRPTVVDIGSGSGLSSRWAATWAGSVTGIEPNQDMRGVAEEHPVPGVSFQPGTAEKTGLADGSADVVLVVQAMHWMDPEPTLAEVGRILRPGGVMAVADADWPPVTGSTRAERAWLEVDRRMRILEVRMVDGTDLHAPIDSSPAALGTARVLVPSGPEERGNGVRSRDKAGHLGRMAASGRFAFTRELVLHQVVEGGAERFVALMRSQGTYQQLRRAGLDDEVLGFSAFEADVTKGFGERPVPIPLSFAWRVRLGVV